jgi:hypothetical protein
LKLNRLQILILLAALVALLCLGLFPPWQQAAEKELAYRKNIGRGLVFRPPSPVPVDCYFVGCKTAPASYFHVLLYRDLLFAQVITVGGVALVLSWMFRTKRDGTSAALTLRRTRVHFSLVAALLVPPDGTFPFASGLLGIPGQLIHQGEFWLVGSILEAVMYFACALAIYGLVSAILWFPRVDRITAGPI